MITSMTIFVGFLAYFTYWWARNGARKGAREAATSLLMRAETGTMRSGQAPIQASYYWLSPRMN